MWGLLSWFEWCIWHNRVTAWHMCNKWFCVAHRWIKWKNCWFHSWFVKLYIRVLLYRYIWWVYLISMTSPLASLCFIVLNSSRCPPTMTIIPENDRPPVFVQMYATYCFSSHALLSVLTPSLFSHQVSVPILIRDPSL